MDVVTLSQWQFAMTSIYHFFFVPLTLGLSVLVAILETIYVCTGKQIYKDLTLFWGKLFVINFAMGVVTGIVQEFQFGMNWSEYSKLVGDVFGAPLAIEALVAFFLESTFLGIWIFGWEKVSKKVHVLAIWLVALASNVSAFWILVANSFMQNPVGYEIQENGRATLTNLGALISNYYVWGQFPHTVLSGFVTGAFFMLGISIYHLIKKPAEEGFKISLRLASIFGIISVIGVGLVGDLQAKRMIQTQPMKMAAAEAMIESEDPASLSLFTITDQYSLHNYVDIRIPYLASFLSYSRFSGEVQGVRPLQEKYMEKYGAGYYIPPIMVCYWSFRIMVGVGILMFAIAAGSLFYSVTGRKIPSTINIKKISLAIGKYMPFAVILPYFATSTGWILTEMGRQPWIVVGLLTTREAVSPSITSGMVLTSLIGFLIVYGILMGVDVYLLVKYAKNDLSTRESGSFTPAYGE